MVTSAVDVTRPDILGVITYIVSPVTAGAQREVRSTSCLRVVPLSPFTPVRNGIRKAVTSFAESCCSGIVLDIGCGQRPYQELFARAQYIGLDVPASGRKIAQKRPDVWFDGRTLPVRSGCADTVICTQVIEHIEDPQQFFAELAGVLKPGGNLILSAPQNERVFEAPYDRFRFTLDGLKMLCSRNGLKVLESKPNLGFWQSVVFDVLSMFYLQLRPKSKLVADLFTAPLSVILNTIAYIADRCTVYNANVNSWIIRAVKL